MAKLFMVLAYFLTISLSAQTKTDFTTKMEAALSEVNLEAKTIQLETLSKDFPKEWLADYYLTQMTINNSMPLLYDAPKLKLHLEKAQAYLDKMYLVEHDTAELYVLQSKLYLVYVMSNPGEFGRRYSGVIANLNNKAFSIAPKNPRVVLTKAQWDIGLAKFYGQLTEEFCIEFDKAVKLFDTFKVKSNIHPNWGSEEANQAAKACK